MTLILASGSKIRAALLKQVGLAFEMVPARIDESPWQRSDLDPKTIATTLAQEKANAISAEHPGRLVIGADQTLNLHGRCLNKAPSRDDCKGQLGQLQGNTHQLHAAVALIRDGETLWQHVSDVTLTMKPLGSDDIERYLDRNWPGISDSVGGYKLEEEGPRLFEKINGDYFAILGLPLLQLCHYLESQGEWVDG